MEADHGVPIGFCLIRRSSGNPIVCFYQSNQISAHSQRKAKARFGLWLGLTSGGRRELPPLSLPGVNRQGQAHIVFTAIVSPGSGKGAGTLTFRTWFSIDPQPASISPTINISIVFICAFLVDCGRTIRIRQSKAILARSCEACRGVRGTVQSKPLGLVPECFIHRFIHRWKFLGVI